MFSSNFIASFSSFILLFSLKLSAAECMSINEDSSSPIIITTVINSSVEKVWDAIIDFKNYGHWNGWVSKIDGEAREGAIVRAYGKTSDLALDLKITRLEQPRVLCWDDVTWFTYFGVGGWRCRTIEVLPDGKSVKFTNHFEYSGVFRWLFSLSTREMLVSGMTLENESLRNFVESGR